MREIGVEHQLLQFAIWLYRQLGTSFSYEVNKREVKLNNRIIFRKYISDSITINVVNCCKKVYKSGVNFTVSNHIRKYIRLKFKRGAQSLNFYLRRIFFTNVETIMRWPATLLFLSFRSFLFVSQNFSLFSDVNKYIPKPEFTKTFLFVTLSLTLCNSKYLQYFFYQYKIV